MPVAECLRLSKDDHILTEARILESDVFMHQCMAESMQARAIGRKISWMKRPLVQFGKTFLIKY